MREMVPVNFSYHNAPRNLPEKEELDAGKFLRRTVNLDLVVPHSYIRRNRNDNHAD